MNELICIIASMAFSITGVLAIKKERDIDVVSAIILGLITAVGGGTVRDIILNIPVFWSVDQIYIWVSILASVLALFGRKIFADQRLFNLMLYLDGLGVAVFGINATGMVWDRGFALPVAPIMLGVITGIGGGLIRDVLANKSTLLMSREFYILPLLLASIIYVLLLMFLPEYRELEKIVCILIAFGFRSAAIRWELVMPKFGRINKICDSELSRTLTKK